MNATNLTVEINEKPHKLIEPQQTSSSNTAKIMPIYKMTNSSSPTSAASVPPKLYYYGGPVISNVKVITIWWGGVSSVVYASQLEGFYAGVTNSKWFRIFNEQSTSRQTIGMGSWVKSYSDASAPRGTVTDAMIQSRLYSLIINGYVPKPDANTYYAIHFAPGIAITYGGIYASCSYFCAYHSVYVRSGLSNIYYGVMPDLSVGKCKSCGGSSSVFNNLCTVASHELGEAVTDPYPYTAWYDPNNKDGGENGDLCYTQPMVGTVGSNGVTYAVQKMWSNRYNACIGAA